MNPVDPVDLTLHDFPVFSLDIEGWTQVNCNYLKIGKISTVISFTSFALLMINIRSCRNFKNDFIAHFSNVLSYFSCIILTETWLTSEVDNVFNIPGFYHYNLYRDRNGGAIKLYIRNNIQTRLLEDFTFKK